MRNFGALGRRICCAHRPSVVAVQIAGSPPQAMEEVYSGPRYCLQWRWARFTTLGTGRKHCMVAIGPPHVGHGTINLSQSTRLGIGITLDNRILY